MQSRNYRPTIAAFVAVLAFCPTLPATSLEVTTAQNTDRLMPYQVFELTFQHANDYADPTWEVAIDVRFHSPSGKEHVVGGFFYGSSQPQEPVIREGDRGSTAEWPCDPADLWKARFAPGEPGRWRFEYVFGGPGGDRAAGSGRFEVVPGRVPQKGFVRIDPDNPFRFVFDDGSRFHPVGWQDGVFDHNHNGSAMDAKSMEGPFRLDDADRRPQPPPGALFARGPSMNPVNGDVYFGRHARAGFNLWRFSPHNFSLPVFDISYDLDNPTPARVRWEQAAMVDEMLQLTRKYGVRNFYGIFGFAKVFNDQPDDPRAMAKVKRIVKYSVDRWGSYVDFWELLNEQKAADGWYAVIAPYLESIDPYGKPIATSWERPELDGIDVSAPHWYGREDELESDRVTADRAARAKKSGKPVVFGEQGNGGGRPELIPQGIGGVWDPGSARRMRVRLWTALFHEISLVFWETSYAKDGHHMNLWIGPQERQYVAALQSFAGRLGSGMQRADVALSGAGAEDVRAYGLRSDECAAVYLHHGACEQCRATATAGRPPHHDWSHDRGRLTGLRLSIELPKASKAYWYDPRDAAILGTVDVEKGSGVVSEVEKGSGAVSAKHPKGRSGKRLLTPFPLEVPPFSVDLALLITDTGPPDIDGDGFPNDADPDDDNDGVPDGRDAWPLEREERADRDGDRIGDNLDADVDADGKADDLDRNGTPDNEEPDWDGDGVANAAAVPWDAFPRDPTEWKDTDGDGRGDNADPDDDGDGFSDEEEAAAGTDPADPVRFPQE